MNIGRPQRATRSTYVPRCILTLLALTALGMAAPAQQPAAAPAPARTAARPSATASAPKLSPVTEEPETKTPNDGAHQGIHVHGHWVLQVKNADGTLGERREFDNSLITTTDGGGAISGSQLLAGVLSGNFTVTPPGIGFVQGPVTGDPSSFCGFFNAPVAGETCYLFVTSNSGWNSVSTFQTPNGVTYGGVSTGLSQTVTFSPSVAITLTGNYTVPTGLTSIAGVQSLYGGCYSGGISSNFTATTGTGVTLSGSAGSASSTVSPSSCVYPFSGATGAFFFSPLTSAAITNSSGVASPIGVTPGQIVTVVFTLSFS